MTEPFPPPSREALARALAVSERHVTVEEIRQALDSPISDEDRREILSLVAWFRRRYPTPAQRLAYVRRAYRRWAAHRPHP